jgi:hypothetical protein
MDPLRTLMLPEKIIALHYVPHGWLAGTLAVPFVLTGVLTECIAISHQPSRRLLKARS